MAHDEGPDTWYTSGTTTGGWGMISAPALPAHTHTITTTDNITIGNGIHTPPMEWHEELNAYEHEHDMVYRVGNEHVTRKTQPFCLICKRTMPQIVAAELKRGLEKHGT